MHILYRYHVVTWRVLFRRSRERLACRDEFVLSISENGYDLLRTIIDLPSNIRESTAKIIGKIFVR